MICAYYIYIMYIVSMNTLVSLFVIPLLLASLPGLSTLTSSELSIKSNSSIVVNDLEDFFELTQSNDKAFDQFKESTIFLRIADDMDENNIHSCYEYKVIDKVSNLQTHYGMKKSGTSALYNILSQYPDVITTTMKENCAFRYDRSIIQYFDSLPSSIPKNKILIDGCVDLDGNLRISKMLKNPNSFYVVLLRSYANWLWSAYNFWCNEDYDLFCCDYEFGTKKCAEEGFWVKPNIHIRSNIVFNDIVMGSMNGTFVNSPLVIKNPCQYGNSFTYDYVHKLWSHISVEKTLILSSEDLDNNSSFVWLKLSQRIGFNINYMTKKVFDHFNSVRYNTQVSKQSRGIKSFTAKTEFKPGLYLVSSMQPLLNNTKNILDKCWERDCSFASTVTGHYYQECSSSDKNKILVSNKNSGKMNSYFSSFSNNNKKFLNMKSYDCNRIESHDRNKNKMKNQNLLVLSLSKEDRYYFNNIIFHFFDFDRYVDITDLKITNKCNYDNYIIGAHPSDIKVTNNNKLTIENDNWACGTPIVFEKVIVLVRDSVTFLWNKYLVSKGIGSGLSGDALINFDWSMWDDAAIHLLTDSLENKDSKIIWSSHHSKVIDKLSSEKKLIFRIDDMLFSRYRKKNFDDLMFFLSKLMTLSSSSVIIKKTGIDMMQCISKFSNYSTYKENILRSHSSLDLAYASDTLLCRIKTILNTSLQLASLSLHSPNLCVSYNSNLESRKCNLRYKHRKYINVVKNHPVVLISNPGRNAVNIRLLVEHSTGIYSGAIETNQSIINHFPGEYYCGQKLSIIYGDTSSVTFKILKNGLPAISMFMKSINKCMKGYIRGFSKGIIIIKDPFKSVWDDYLISLGNRTLPEDLDKLNHLEESHMIDQFIEISKNYSLEKFDIGDTYSSANQYFQQSNIILVSYESLLNPISNEKSTRVINNSKTKNNNNNISPKIKSLQTLLSFAGYDNIYQERLLCSYKFIESAKDVKVLQQLNSFFLSHRGLICEMYLNFNIKFATIKFNITTLYNDVSC